MTQGVRSTHRREASTRRARPSVGLPDAWWPIAFGDEVGRHPRAFRLGIRDLAVYRDLRGVVRAVDDTCPHRRLPLSMGRITEDGYLQCPYHGWCFDGSTGQCTAIPNLSEDERVPRGIKVAAFSTAENVADALGWSLRTPALAPRVGPPTGEEPDDGTTMFDARVRDGLVLVWTGDELPDSDGLPASEHEDRPAPFSGKAEIRAPHSAVCDAVLWNPGALLGLGRLLGAGDEANNPIIEEQDATITVRRERYALDLPRASTYGSLSKRVVSSSTTMVVDSGLTWIDVPRSGRRPAVRVVLGLTPVSPYRTVIRWTGSAGAGWLQRALTVAGRVGRRATARAEAVVDASDTGTDEGMARLRGLRARRAKGESTAEQGDPS